MKNKLLLILGVCLLTLSTFAQAKEQSLHNKMLEFRATEALVWAMPMLNFKHIRDGMEAVGVKRGDIAYNSKMQDWKFQVATANNTTPYITFFYNIENGPMVIEIPASANGVGIFGTIMDAWERPIDDVGAAGRDKGRGAKYVILPENYQGPLLPNAYTYTQRTNNGIVILRPIIADDSPENLAKAAAFAKKIKVYPLSEASSPKPNRYVDVYGKVIEATPDIDVSTYKKLDEMVQEENIEAQNLAMMGLLAQIGIKKGMPFNPSPELKKIYAKAAPQAHQYMIEEYHRYLNQTMYKGTKWKKLVPPGVIETDFSYEFPNFFDYVARGPIYYAIISSVKNYGSATFYVGTAETDDGQWLDGSKNYELVVPANVPVKDFWAVTTYDLDTAAYQRDIAKSSIDSNQKALKTNKDGTVTIYFGPKAPKGKASNWLPTVKGRNFFLLFRFYGPTKKTYDGSWKLDSIKLVK